MIKIGILCLLLLVVFVIRKRVKKNRHIAALMQESVQNFDETEITDVVVEIPPKTEDEIVEERPVMGDVITIMLVADKGNSYGGFDLLQSLLTNGLRFGKYNIFHYYELDKKLFSLASAKDPGTFDMEKMERFSTPALCMFMEITQDEHLATNFEKMLQTAKYIIKELGGYLIDDQKQELNDSRIQQLRMKLRRVENKEIREELHEYSE